MNSRTESGEEKTIELAESSSEKDLGVTVDADLTFRQHIQNQTAKADKILGVIRRSFDHLDTALFVQLFKSLVRPVLEYGHAVWEPQHKTLRQEVEQVQRRATKLLASIRDKPYPERLAALNLPSLEHRRKRGDMIEVYKYTHGFYHVSQPHLKQAEEKGCETRGHSFKLQKNIRSRGPRGIFFSERVVNTWNGLPENVVSAPTLNAFKNRLDRFWEKLPSKFDPECYN